MLIHRTWLIEVNYILILRLVHFDLSILQVKRVNLRLTLVSAFNFFLILGDLSELARVHN